MLTFLLLLVCTMELSRCSPVSYYIMDKWNQGFKVNFSFTPTVNLDQWVMTVDLNPGPIDTLEESWLGPLQRVNASSMTVTSKAERGHLLAGQPFSDVIIVRCAEACQDGRSYTLSLSYEGVPSTAPPTTTQPANSTATTAAAPTSGHTISACSNVVDQAPRTRCLQCGDVASQTPCTEQELASGQDTACGPGKHFCMTDAYRLSAGSNLTVFKRCVDEVACLKDYFLQILQTDYCQHLDATVPDILACHLCCHGNACNTGLVPANLYMP